MKLKLKQSPSNSKNILLPYLSQNKNHRYTPRSNTNNRSKQKMPQINHTPQQIKQIYSKISKIDKGHLKQKIKALHIKKKYQQIPLHNRHQSSLSRQYEDAQLTTNLKKEIQKNLAFIKKQKQDRKKTLTQQKKRYQTRSNTIQKQQKIKKRQSQKCITQQKDIVFNKINQIINKSHSKSTLFNQEQERNISYSSYLNNNHKHKHKQQKCSLEDFLLDSCHMQRKKFKTQQQSLQLKNNQCQSPLKQHSNKQLKNVENYHQWRKVSIDQSLNSKVSYKLSSYENETERLQKITNKNEMSLKRYIQGKTYLSKLIKFKNAQL